MNRISKLLFPVLVLGVSMALLSTVHVPNVRAATQASLQVNFGSSPQWGYVPGTRVREIRGQRPDYDAFRYGNQYYVYNNDQWYSSRRARGQYRPMDERYVPKEINRVPRDHWHNYPSRWNDNNGQQGTPGGRDHH